MIGHVPISSPRTPSLRFLRSKAHNDLWTVVTVTEVVVLQDGDGRSWMMNSRATVRTVRYTSPEGEILFLCA